MSTSRDLTFFRAYDVRGEYPSELGPEQAFRLGGAIGRACPGALLIGRDTREESRQFERKLRDGLADSGRTVRSIGIVPVPGLSFLARRARRVGLMVTPSHNALGQVGLKGFLPDGTSFAKVWRKVRAEYKQSKPRAQSLPPRRAWSEVLNGRLYYLAHVARGRHSRMRVVVDSRGGAASRWGPAALRRLGAKVFELNPGFSATFFGGSPEPSPSNVRNLQQAVMSKRADVGVAFDGDGDRALFVDAGGMVVAPEAIGVWLRRSLSDRGEPLVVSSDASPRCEKLVPTVRSRVGTRYMTQTMVRVGATIGVEASSHFYLSKWAPDSDGILTACVLLDALSRQVTTLQQVRKEFGRVYRRNLHWDFASDREVRRTFLNLHHQMVVPFRPVLDGILLDVGVGWCFARKSNTGPTLRVALETNTPSELERLSRSVNRLVDGSISAEGRPATEPSR
jgi:phosphomannomutase